MALYNLTIVANQSGIVPMMQQVNSGLMFGWYGSLMLMSLCAILFMAFFSSTNSAKRAISAATFICWLVSMPLRYFNLLPDLAVYITFVAMLISAASLFLSKDG